MTTMQKSLAAAAAMLLGLAGLPIGAPPAHADPVFHQVTYIVRSQNPVYVDIFYQDQDPTVFADYSHNPYSFTPQTHADVGPNKPWIQTVPLINPDQWAMVTVTAGSEPGLPQIHCDLAVDGRVVVSKDGARGALCSLRTW
jgi:hypothetical protein